MASEVIKAKRIQFMTSYALKGYMQSFNNLASKLWLFIRFWNLAKKSKLQDLKNGKLLK